MHSRSAVSPVNQRFSERSNEQCFWVSLSGSYSFAITESMVWMEYKKVLLSVAEKLTICSFKPLLESVLSEEVYFPDDEFATGAKA